MSQEIKKERAIALLQAGRYTESKILCKELLSSDPLDSELNYLLSLIYANTNSLKKAAFYAEKTITIAPQHAGAYYVLGRVHYRLHSYVSARELLTESISLRSNFPEALLILGKVELALKRHIHAVQYFNKALALKPGYESALVSLADYYFNTGDTIKARKLTRELLKNNSLHPSARLINVKIMRNEGRCDEARCALEEMLGEQLDEYYRANILNEYGLLLEIMGDYDEAFLAFSEAQQIHAARNSGQFDRSELYSDFAKLKSVTKQCATLKGNRQQENARTRRPIFLVGFPRSGTTLAEQLLAAHSLVVTSDEAPLLSRTIDAIPTLTSSEYVYPDVLLHLSPSEIEKIQNYYWSLVRGDFGLKGKHVFVDKNPMAMGSIGAIHCLFPHAKIIYMSRDPRDVCMSCYFQLFKPNKGMMHFTTLESTVNLFTEMIDNWEATTHVLALDILCVRYEKLVTDFEIEIKRMLRFIGLEWEAGVQKYHIQASRRYVSTPSKDSVIEPVYSRSIGKWQYYADYLRPYLNRLDPYITSQGYDV